MVGLPPTPGKRRLRGCSRPSSLSSPTPAASGTDAAPPLVDDDASDGLSLVHELEALVDVLERQLVGDQVVDVDLLLHIPVDDLRDVGPAPGAAKGRALPNPAGHQLE